MTDKRIKSYLDDRLKRLESIRNEREWTTAELGDIACCKQTLAFIDSMQKEHVELKEVDLEKLGEIARHLIAVKKHIEDMRLDKDEWSMLEKIGYPEKFKAQKGK